MKDSISSAIIESMSDGLFVLDFRGYFTHINRAALKLLGIRREQIHGNTYLQVFMDSPETDEFNDILFDGIQNRETRSYREVPFKNRDGNYYDLAVTTSFLRPASGQSEKTGIVVVFKDITEFKALERARHRVINHLSHELKTPLSIIVTSLKTAESSIKEKTLARISRNLKRLQDIQLEVEDIIETQDLHQTRNLLPWLEQTLDFIDLMAEEDPGQAQALNSLKGRIKDFFQTDASDVQDINVSNIVRKAADLAKRLSSKRDIILSTMIKEDIHLRIAPDAIEKSVTGLIKNAIENTPDGGKVVISIQRDNGTVTLEVKDTGIGITPESSRQIFGGFYHAQDTNLYSTKKPYDFEAGGKGLDLLRIKIFGEMYNFDVECETVRCRYIPQETNPCPGKISDCPHVKNKEQCAKTGGSVFRLIFSQQA